MVANQPANTKHTNTIALQALAAHHPDKSSDIIKVA